jgi:8-oxo-dGTP pyrophosphatase MutT (NUDIX family)
LVNQKPEIKDVPVRDAATVIVVREGKQGPSVLMGQRGAGAVFMPSKYVFPGGAVDAADRDVTLGRALHDDDAIALAERAICPANALAVAAVRELLEETGQRLLVPHKGATLAGVPDAAPDAAGLRFVFRAVTPPGRPRRFDARFFMIRAETLTGDPDDFSAAEDELSHLHWVPLREARALDVPFITEVVLAEVAARLDDGPAARGVPFFDNTGDTSIFRYLGRGA